MVQEVVRLVWLEWVRLKLQLLLMLLNLLLLLLCLLLHLHELTLLVHCEQEMMCQKSSECVLFAGPEFRLSEAYKEMEIQRRIGLDWIELDFWIDELG